jgi:hypothetical protein
MPPQPNNMKGLITSMHVPPSSPFQVTSRQLAGRQYALQFMDLLIDATGPTATAKQILPTKDIQQLTHLLKLAYKGIHASNLSF